MKVFVLLVFIPSLITADFLCPNSKTTCPEDKQCCEVDGEYSCCDPDIEQDVPARRLKVYAGVEVMSSAPFANLSFSMNESKLHYGSICNSFNCDGKCCGDSWDGCCPYSLANCCSANRCCPALNECCGRYCCGSFQKCCGNGCCETLQTCCGNGCCDYGYNCCESWCCKKGSRCGSGYRHCISKGVTISPEFVALILLAAIVFISHRL